MNDFPRRIAAGDKFPSVVFNFKTLDPAVLKHNPPAPECVKVAIGGFVYSVTRLYSFINHGAPLPFATKAV
jgi:hypothetical protein